MSKIVQIEIVVASDAEELEEEVNDWLCKNSDSTYGSRRKFLGFAPVAGKENDKLLLGIVYEETL